MRCARGTQSLNHLAWTSRNQMGKTTRRVPQVRSSGTGEPICHGKGAAVA